MISKANKAYVLFLSVILTLISLGVFYFQYSQRLANIGNKSAEYIMQDFTLTNILIGCALITWLSYYWTCYLWLKAKGYPGRFGIIGMLGIIGVIIAIFIPRRQAP